MIKKLSLVSLFTLLPASFYFAQTTAFAYLKDAEGKPVERANVSLKGEGNDVTADKIGYFQFVDLKPGHYQIIVAKPNFETKVLEFDVSIEKKKDLGVITLYSSLSGADQGLVVLSNTGDDENSSQSSTVGLLQSSQDVFNRTASFDLGAYWFRPRGVDGRTSEIMFNGVSMVAPNDGNVDFINWGGLNEITRYPDISANHAPSEYAFGGVGSVAYKNTLASEYRKGSQLTYSLTNRNYRNRLSYRFSSGMSRSGWAFTGMIARRWAQEGIQDGTFYDAVGAYIGIEKKINDNHTITFNAMGSPYKRSTSSPNTQEVYDFTDVHYNAYWGWQDGRKRSERVKKGFMPILQLSDYLKIGKNATLWTTLSYQFGKETSSRLDWYRANNPSPGYYKNLPSYYQQRMALNKALGKPDNPVDQKYLDERLDWWTNNDPEHTQINWDQLYQKNYSKKHTSSLDKSAAYWLVDDVNEDKIWNGATRFTYNFANNAKLIINASYQNYYSEQYREINDLLGADYALNQDGFAKDKDGGKFNTLESDTHKIVGNKINYNYIYRRQEAKINPGFKFTTGNFDVFVSGLAAYTSASREGLFSHYLYKNSFGKSGDQNYWDFGVKGQVTYKVNGRNFIVYNGAYFSQAPFMNDIFINARVSNVVAPNLKSTIFNANDLSYVISSPTLKLRLTGYLVDTKNETNVQRFFADGIKLTAIDESGGESVTQSTFVNQIMSNVEKRNMGAELGVQVKITPTLTLNGLASYGQYTYQNNPNVYLIADASGVLNEVVNGNVVTKNFKDLGVSHLKDYKQGGTPQEAYSLGFRYSSPKYWWVGGNWNYLGNNYLDPSPALRTENFIQNPSTHTPYENLDQESLTTILTQRKLPSANFVNLNAGKSWLIGKYYFMISATVNNILDNKNYITGGFEQTRDVNYRDLSQDISSGYSNFGPKLWYTQGRSYFINAQFRF